jgi:hypothetical protein
MGYERLAYDDQDTTHQMHDDCLVCSSQMRIPHQALVPELLDLTGAESGKSSVPKQRKEIEVSDAAAHLASRLHLHLD